MTETQPMKLRPLGQTNILVTPIGLGGNKFSGGKGLIGMIMPDLSQTDVTQIVATALANGVNWIDTAEMYGFGHSERAIAAALRALGKGDDEVVIATKWNPLLRTAANIARTIDKRIDCLDGYTIDLYMVHNPLSFSAPETEMAAMSDLVTAGKIRAVGVSNFNIEQMERAHKALAERGLPLAVNQVEYSLTNRRIEGNGLLNAARDLGVTIIAWAPLGSGLLTGKYHEPGRLAQLPFGRRLMLRRNLARSRPLVNALTEIGARYDATPAQVALNWIYNFQGDSVVTIPGASKARHAQESAGALRFTLSEADMSLLDECSRQFR